MYTFSCNWEIDLFFLKHSLNIQSVKIWKKSTKRQQKCYRGTMWLLRVPEKNIATGRLCLPGLRRTLNFCPVSYTAHTCTSNLQYCSFSSWKAKQNPNDFVLNFIFQNIIFQTWFFSKDTHKKWKDFMLKVWHVLWILKCFYFSGPSIERCRWKRRGDVF